MKDITVIGLIYRSKLWLEFMARGIMRAQNFTPFNLMIVGNDPEPEVRNDPYITHVYNDPQPNDHYASRTYRCWNYAAEKAETPYIIFINSDMYVSDWWIDGLWNAMPLSSNEKVIPTSLLIESGRIPSAMPEWVTNFGQHPGEFRRDDFLARASELREPLKTSPGRLYMPCLLDREEFLRRGGFPTSPTLANDVDLWKRMIADGYRWLTCHGSVVYHVCRGEMAAMENQR